MIPMDLSGKVALVTGVGDQYSFAWFIAKALQALMADPWLHTGIDEHAPHVPAKFTTVTSLPDPVLSEYFTMIYSEPVDRVVEDVPGRGEGAYGRGDLVDVQTGAKGLHLIVATFHGIAAMAAAGVNLVVDEVFFDPRVLEAAVDALAQSDVLFVGLQLPLAVAEKRERERGDRGPGGARLFYDRVHAHGIYDLELDTSQHTPLECAQIIQQALAEGHPRRAFQELA
jgi:chloramphenicol 3-O phosphotransferase